MKDSPFTLKCALWSAFTDQTLPTCWLRWVMTISKKNWRRCWRMTLKRPSWSRISQGKILTMGWTPSPTIKVFISWNCASRPWEEKLGMGLLKAISRSIDSKPWLRSSFYKNWRSFSRKTNGMRSEWTSGCMEKDFLWIVPSRPPTDFSL